MIESFAHSNQSPSQKCIFSRAGKFVRDIFEDNQRDLQRLDALCTPFRVFQLIQQERPARIYVCLRRYTRLIYGRESSMKGGWRDTPQLFADCDAYVYVLALCVRILFVKHFLSTPFSSCHSSNSLIHLRVHGWCICRFLIVQLWTK